ncbi:hypothetical protein B5C34_01200 [Pacificimonas flava]|uniref:TonB-dependent receptor n=2 Tax=Pacificimonas TaxID=1960290 RepID=A0A219B1J4_9SPHN|nr:MULTISPECIES: TonB-dependent receptor [Pacificimonas]MBZ6378168.1 TonB-dependent receptor [Pacificimonas aurantium]OWV32201.1 hypothetical protein B5C34_01200 [Pacificimonas flava]
MKSLFLGAAGAAALASAAATPVFAQAAEPVVDDIGNDVIVVTAQKREELITDVPLTISAISAEQMERIGVDEFDELSAFIPGLNVQEQSANNPGFVIRGITSDSGSAQQGPRVTIYYNGVDVSRSRGSYFKLYDLDRIEVVKGPQATLFGTAATIGAVSVVSAKPEPEPAAFVTASYGNYDAVEVQGMVNGGSDMVSARLAGFYEYRRGYVENIAGEAGTASAAIVGTDQDDLNGLDQFGLRGSVRVTPDIGVIDLVVTYEQQNNPGTAFVSGTIPATGGDTSPYTEVELGGSPVSGEILGIDKLKLERDVFDVNLTVELPLSDALTLTSVNGYRRFEALETFDADGSALYFLEFAEDAQGDQLSSELRLSYDDGGMIRGFFGGNIFMEDGFQRVPFSSDEGTFFACLPSGLLPEPLNSGVLQIQGLLSQAQGGLGSCVAPDGTLLGQNASAILTQGAATVIPYDSEYTNFGENNVYSLFADVTVVPTPALELTAGVRYLYEERTSKFSSIQPDSFLFNLLGQQAGLPGLSLPLIPTLPNTNGQVFTASDDFDAWLPRFAARFDVSPDVSVYGTVSKGRRAPVLDLDGPPATNLNLIEEERVWNYEGGVKTATGPFSGSVGVFYQEYTNFQVTLVDEATGELRSVNAGQAESLGVEAEAQLRIAPWLNLFGSYAFIDAEVSEANDPGSEGAQFAGDRFRLQPKHSGAVGAAFSYDLGGGTALSLTPTATYRSKVYFTQPNDEALSQDGYWLVNLRGGVSFDDDRYAVTGFVTNLLDEEYLIDAGNTGSTFGTATFIPGEPALYGVAVSARF